MTIIRGHVIWGRWIGVGLFVFTSRIYLNTIGLRVVMWIRLYLGSDCSVETGLHHPRPNVLILTWHRNERGRFSIADFI